MKRTLQFERTHRDIEFAFVRLAGEKPFEKITVQNILEEAMINRSTFYQHFKDKYEIAEKLQEDTMSALMEVFGEIRTVDKKEHDHIDDLMRLYFIKNRGLLRVLLRIKTEHVDIEQKWRDLFHEYYRRVQHESSAGASGTSTDAEAMMCANIMVGFLRYCLELEPVPESYSRRFADIFMNVVVFTLGVDMSAIEKQNAQKSIVKIFAPKG